MYILRKVISVIFSLILYIPALSCIESSKSWEILPTEKEIFDTRLEQILYALENEDKVGLKNLFSTYILELTDVDLDSGVENIMAFFQGEIISYEAVYQPSSRETIDSGEREKWIDGYATVKTNKGDFFIYIIEQTLSTQDESRVGLYLLQIMLTDDNSKFLSNYETMGIVVPSDLLS